MRTSGALSIQAVVGNSLHDRDITPWGRQLAQEDAERRDYLRSTVAWGRRGAISTRERAVWERKRKHPRIQLGDVFGDRKVVRLLPRDKNRAEVVAIACALGHEKASTAFNLRRSPDCPTCKALRRASR
jgi:hypothetical protein